jgi:hypothetical protein
MADDKDKKKKVEGDDMFGEMDDVLGEKKPSESADTPTPVPNSGSPIIKHTNDTFEKFGQKVVEIDIPDDVPSSGDANTVNHVAEKFDIWLPLKIDNKWYSYGIEEITPELFIEWVHGRLPGMKKNRPLKPEQCNTAQKRLDIFEEVSDLLTRCHYAGRKNRDTLNIPD